jgi:phosphate binding protein
MLKLRTFVTAVVLMLAMSLTSVMAQSQTIVDIAAGNEDFSTLVSLVQAAGLVETLAGEGPFTVFAPTNDAFAAIPGFVVDYLLADTDVLTQILTYHVVAGKVMSSDVAAGKVATVNGDSITITIEDGMVILDNVAMVTVVDIEASNGVIHVIDTVILPEITLPEVDALSVSDNIIVAGSSTVFPVTERMADLFNQDGFAGTITVDSIGTGAGFERFCANAETDISNASRAIKSTEAEACVANGRTPLEFFVGIDALAVVVNDANDFVYNLTVEDIARIFNDEVKTWNEIDPSFPAETILKFSPGTDSGTFDYFVEAVLGKNREGILNASNIQFSEDDNVLVQGVNGSPFAIGYFGFAYYAENTDTLRALNVNGVEPNERTAEAFEYPLSRPLYIYSAAEILAEKPQVASFISYYLSNVNDELGTEEGQIGYFPVSKYAMSVNRIVFAATAMMAGN